MQWGHILWMLTTSSVTSLCSAIDGEYCKFVENFYNKCTTLEGEAAEEKFFWGWFSSDLHS